MAQVNLGRVVGYSAYEIAVQNGFVGTEAEWLASLKGEQGEVGPAGPAGTTSWSGINDKPFSTIGTGLEVVNGALNATGGSGGMDADGVRELIANDFGMENIANEIVSLEGVESGTTYNYEDGVEVGSWDHYSTPAAFSERYPYLWVEYNSALDGLLQFKLEPVGSGGNGITYEGGVINAPSGFVCRLNVEWDSSIPRIVYVGVGMDAETPLTFEFGADDMLYEAEVSPIKAMFLNNMDGSNDEIRIATNMFYSAMNANAEEARYEAMYDDAVNDEQVSIWAGVTDDSAEISLYHHTSSSEDELLLTPEGIEFNGTLLENGRDGLTWGGDALALVSDIPEGSFPTVNDMSGNEGMLLAVNSLEDGYSFKPIPIPDGTTITASNGVWSASIPSVNTLSAGSGITLTTSGSVDTIAVTNPVPTFSAADDGKVLTLTTSGTVMSWETPSGGGSSYTAGAGIAIDANNVISTEYVAPIVTVSNLDISSWSTDVKTTLASAIQARKPITIYEENYNNNIYRFWRMAEIRLQSNRPTTRFVLDRDQIMYGQQVLDLTLNTGKTQVNNVTRTAYPQLPSLDGASAGQVVAINSTVTNLEWVDPLPACPTTTDGTFVLKATVSSGAVTYSWVAEN